MLSRFMTRREQFVLVFFASAIIIGCIVMIATRPEQEAARIIQESAPQQDGDIADAPDETAPEPIAEIVVSVQGAVRLPGVYRFAETQRVMDAIQEAGGLSESADTATLNLAAVLVDATTIIVPQHGTEEPVVSHASYLLAQQSPGAVNGGAAPESTADKININTATVTELETLPGIGPTYARAIVNRRDQAPFRSIEDIQEVHGIGEKRFDQMRDLITVQ